ncbi:hsp70-like protein [Colletotrichum scovillei]|uniref:Hsp70-like protein n=1 Tax=Colletotrichum scovillei TaxID=1209932 RepID=A0A9P7RCA9_9PEZI|nr:hsp70-like protein [Colletotrichum scovillei]KAG7072311.1 hsp70-like protein [Colletotrichum scovillei]KAG7080751.1 hsp70-like protein [Colletotrichum scovillei]
MNPHNNSVFDAKRLIGRKFQDSEVHCVKTIPVVVDHNV